MGKNGGDSLDDTREVASSEYRDIQIYTYNWRNHSSGI